MSADDMAGDTACDVVVVGAGLAGGLVAASLARAGGLTGFWQRGGYGCSAG